MNPTTAVVLIGLIVTAGRWAEDKPMSISVVVGVAILAIALSVLSETNPKLGSSFTLLILVTVVLRYTIPITTKLRLSK